MDSESAPAPRESRKQRTHQALLDAALHLMEGDKSFASLSLREVTRAAGIVPTAFYRHFHDMEELGLLLVDECFRTLRQMIRAVRAAPLPQERIIRGSAEILMRQVQENRSHFQFIARERYGGVAALRLAIRREIRLFVSELATDLARFPHLNRWSTEDLQMMAQLMVGAMVNTAEDILSLPPQRQEQVQDIVRTAEKQLRLVALGVPHWRSADVPVAAQGRVGAQS
jgi:AcrR family transcriptional regulator